MKQIGKNLVILFLLLFAANVYAQTETGEASYYNDKFHGKLTAMGELYDKTKLTAAHRTHHVGTMLKVTRTDNNQSVIVRVNDRGPFKAGRIIDLSRAAAEKIDLITAGVAPVRVEVVTSPDVSVYNQPKAQLEKRPEEVMAEKSAPPVMDVVALTIKGGSGKKALEKTNPPASYNKIVPEEVVVKSVPTEYANLPATEPLKTEEMPKGDIMGSSQKGYGVQVASFVRYDDALAHVARLQKKWFKNIFIVVKNGSDGISRYGVVMGPFPEKVRANSYKSNLMAKYNMDGFLLELK